jgi:aminoglycoside 2'-N-acetyltransferase I
MAINATTELYDAIGPVDGSAMDQDGSVARPLLARPESARWLAGVSPTIAATDDPTGWYQRALAMHPVVAGARISQLSVANLSADERQQTVAFTRHTLDRDLGRIRPLALPADSYVWTAPTWSVLVKADLRVVAHAGITYRVIQVDNVRVPVAGIGGVMTLPDWRRRGYARAMLENATAFAGLQLWAPFAVVICPEEDTAFYQHLGWRVAEAPIWCEQPGGPVRLPHELALYLACQGDADWPSGPIHLQGTPW